MTPNFRQHGTTYIIDTNIEKTFGSVPFFCKNEPFAKCGAHKHQKVNLVTATMIFKYPQKYPHKKQNKVLLLKHNARI